MNDPVNIGISKAEMARFRRQMKAIVETKAKRLQEVVATSAYRIQSDARAATPRYTSALVNSIKVVHGNDRLSARVRTDKEYAQFIEFGTKTRVKVPAEIVQYAAQFKGSNPGGSFKEMVNAIRLWCKRKGIPEAAAYPIAVKLLQVGQKPQPFLYPAFKNEEPKFIQRIAEVMQ